MAGLKIIWIDEEIENEENQYYLSVMQNFLNLNVDYFDNIENGIEYLKKIKFEKTKIIVSGKFYVNFIKEFKKNIKYINTIPKIVIFTRDADKFKEENIKDENIINHSYYNYGGIKTTFQEIKDFLKDNIVINIKKNIDNAKLTFEYIDCKEKLVLPMFYKSLIDLTEIDNIENYTDNLNNKYKSDNKEIEDLLDYIKSMPDIPIELLCKYYARIYTADSKFYEDINNDLINNKKENYLPFIKILYEGVKFKALPLASESELYRGAKISIKEIKKIKTFLDIKKENLPGAIVFSKSFLSFSKSRDIAINFMMKPIDQKNNEKYPKRKNEISTLKKVLYILEKDDKMEYNLSTHGDIEDISCFPDEKEVLFFPFSAFEIKGEPEEIEIYDETVYEIKLKYLGKYLKEIEKDKNIINKEINIPDTQFKQDIVEAGLINEKKIKNTKQLFNIYKKYKKKIKENDEECSNGNYIISKIKVEKDEINKYIKIINPLGNVEINKERIEIEVNGKKIKTFYYDFNSEGEYTIKYIFKTNLTTLKNFFALCSNITYIDLSHFNTEKITNMSNMFYNCSSLVSVNLSNINTCNVTDMSSMFYSCSSLKNLNLSNFNTIKVIDMSNMFYNCKSLENLNLSNFIASKKTNLTNMFDKCESLQIKGLITNSDEILNCYKKQTNYFLINKIKTIKLKIPKQEKIKEVVYNIHTENSSNDYSKEKNNKILYTQGGEQKIKLKPINKINPKKKNENSGNKYSKEKNIIVNNINAISGDQKINLKLISKMNAKIKNENLDNDYSKEKNKNFNICAQSVDKKVNLKPLNKINIKKKNENLTTGKKKLNPLNKYYK